MTMKEFKKYLNKVIEQKELKEITENKFISRCTKTYQTHLNIQIKEYKDIRKVINS